MTALEYAQKVTGLPKETIIEYLKKKYPNNWQEKLSKPVDINETNKTTDINDSSSNNDFVIEEPSNDFVVEEPSTMQSSDTQSTVQSTMIFDEQGQPTTVTENEAPKIVEERQKKAAEEGYWVNPLTGQKELTEEPGLESDVLFPVTPEFKLADKLITPIISKLVSIWATRGIPAHIVEAVKSGDEQTLKEYLQSINKAKELGLGDEVIKSNSKPSGNIFEQQNYANLRGPKIEQDIRKDLEPYVEAKKDVGEEIKFSATKLHDKMKQEIDSAYREVEKSASNLEYDIRPLKENLIKFKEFCYKICNTDKGVKYVSCEFIE